MIIKYIHVENVKGIKDAELSPGSLVIMSGKNGAGKSTFGQDAIMYALNGGKGIPAEVIREGQKTGMIELHLGGEPEGELIKVIRNFKTGNTKGTLKVVADKKGMTDQQLLDSIRGAIGFRPVDFMDADKKKQRDMLLDGFGLTEKLEAIEREAKGIYDKRHAKGAEVRLAEGAVKTLEHQEVPEAIDIAKEQARLADIKQAHAGWVQMTNALNDAEAQKERLVNRVMELESELKKAKEALGTCEGSIATMMDNLTGEPDDGSQLEQTLREAYAVNQRRESALANNARREAAVKEHQARDAEYKALDSQYKDLIASKDSLLAAVEWPVEGLGFDEDGLLLNGREFAVASLGERLMAACRICMAMNPVLKIMLIDGNPLDDDNLEMLINLALEHGYQPWIEVINSEHATVEFVDGKIKEHKNGEEEN